VAKFFKVAGVLVVLGAVAVGTLMSVGASAAPAKSAQATACGGIPYVAPNDPSNLLPGLKLSKGQQHDYTGWKFPLLKSAWSN